MKLNIAYGNTKFTLDINKKDTSLDDLKRLIEEKTCVPVSRQKLLAGGSVIKNNPQAKLNQFGMLKDGAKIMVSAMPEAPEPPPRTSSLPVVSQPENTEEKLVTRIQQLVDKAMKVVPMIDEFEKEIKGEKPVSLVGHKTLETYYKEEHAKISESLLQVLLELDDVICEPEQEIARSQRRSAVKLLQSFLERVDHVKQNALKVVGKM